MRGGGWLSIAIWATILGDGWLYTVSREMSGYVEISCECV
jgi:hypothetical protein